MTQEHAHDDSAIRPDSVVMLCQGDEVYGVGSVLKIYAEVWPSLSFIALGEGVFVDWLRANGNRVDVVPGLMKFNEGGASVLTLLRMPGVILRARRDAAKIDAILKPRGIRVVHAHWRPQQIIAGFLRRRGYLSVWHIHNNMTPQRLFGLGGKLNHLLAHWGADLLITVSNFIARNWNGSGVPTAVVHNAVPALYKAPNVLPDSPVRCLIAGRLEHEKGHHLAIEGVMRARKSGLDVHLDIFGGPMEGNPYVEALLQRIAEAGCSDVICFLGFQPDLRSRHQQYHLGLQCRISPEPCSVWICETLVDGLPLVASASGGTPELVEDGVTALLFPTGNVDALTEKLTELASQPNRINAMRSAAFKRGEELFTVGRFADETLHAYESARPV